jgi:hypothetical protein
MNYMLKIGYRSYVLPSNRGLQTVLDTLSRAQEVDEDRRYDGRGIKLKTEPVTCSIEALSGYSFVKRGDKRSEVFEPEIMPPERKSRVSSVQALRLLANVQDRIDTHALRMISQGEVAR